VELRRFGEQECLCTCRSRPKCEKDAAQQAETHHWSLGSIWEALKSRRQRKSGNASFLSQKGPFYMDQTATTVPNQASS
jgi:hypothetical protein